MQNYPEYISLPYQGRRLKPSAHSSYDHLESFKAVLPSFINLPRTTEPSRYGASLKLTHNSEIQSSDYTEIYLLLVNGGFISADFTFTEDHFSRNRENNLLLRDTVIIPGTDINREVIRRESGLFEYFWRQTFTNPTSIIPV